MRDIRRSLTSITSILDSKLKKFFTIGFYSIYISCYTVKTYVNGTTGVTGVTGVTG